MYTKGKLKTCGNYVIDSDTDKIIFEGTSIDNSKKLVKRWNAHEALVEAVEWAIDRLEILSSQGRYSHGWEKLQQALKQAKER